MKQVSATVAGGPRDVAFAVFQFTGADQRLPTGPYVSRSGGSGQPAITTAHPAGQWLAVHACHVDQSGTVQSNYAVTQTDQWAFTGAAGAWAIGAVPLVPTGAPDAGTPDVGPSPDAAAPQSLPAADGGPATAIDQEVRDTGAVESRSFDLEVGCACRAGGRSGKSAAPLWLVLFWLRRRRDRVG